MTILFNSLTYIRIFLFVYLISPFLITIKCLLSKVQSKFEPFMINIYPLFGRKGVTLF
jgi:hypothetical protein